VRELDMTVDEALKYIISMGVVAPRLHLNTLPAHDQPPGASVPAAPGVARAESEIRN